jgi:Mg2+ and Co2+ transporter CorA
MFLAQSLELEQLYKIERDNDEMEVEISKQELLSKTREIQQKTVQIKDILSQKADVLQDIYMNLKEYDEILEIPAGVELKLQDQRELTKSLQEIKLMSLLQS